jgi:SAM-dependent methyltransferase
MPPVELRFMRESDQRFLQIGDETLTRIRELAGLSAGSSIVDIGCGYGRLAHALMRWPEFAGSYLGLDILPRHIDWCARSLSPLAPNQFRFDHIDVRNDRYNPSGTIRAKNVRLPVGDGSADCVALVSVFTHMYHEELLHYLTEVRRILTPAGRAYATILLIDESWEDLNREGAVFYSFPHQLNAFTRYMDADDPLHAIAYEESWVRAQLATTGLRLRSSSYGTWRGSGKGPELQDVLVLSRD